jgi:hypothetical protein
LDFGGFLADILFELLKIIETVAEDLVALQKL